MDAISTGERISRLRKEKGMTQRELAERLHVTNKAVSKWETGKNYPDLALLQTLAETLGTSVSQLLGVEQPINGSTIEVLSVVSRQEQRSILRSLYLYIAAAVLVSGVCLAMHFAADDGAQLLMTVHILLVLGGVKLLEQLHRKHAAPKAYRWPSSQSRTLWQSVRLQLALWGERLREK